MLNESLFVLSLFLATSKLVAGIVLRLLGLVTIVAGSSSFALQVLELNFQRSYLSVQFGQGLCLGPD